MRMSRHAFWSQHYIKQMKYIFCAAFIDFVSCYITFVLSLKRFKKLFYIKF